MKIQRLFLAISLLTISLGIISDPMQLVKCHPESFEARQAHTVFQPLGAGLANAQTKGFDSNSIYKKELIHGFSVWINQDVLEHKQEAKELRKELNWQLSQIDRVVPAKPLSAIHQVRIWVEWQTQNGAAQFHPSAEWLQQNGYNPDKAGSVEVSNTINFVNWSRTTQPWMILHELAHAYHFRFLGDRSEIEFAYQHALNNKLYESVDYIQGGKQKAYALTNFREYYAELSEAYFGKNDFYPFTRSELKKYDSVGYHLMEETWGKPRATKR